MAHTTARQIHFPLTRKNYSHANFTLPWNRRVILARQGTKHRQVSCLACCTPRPLTFDTRKTRSGRPRNKIKGVAVGSRKARYDVWRCFVHPVLLIVTTHETQLKILYKLSSILKQNPWFSVILNSSTCWTKHVLTRLVPLNGIKSFVFVFA